MRDSLIKNHCYRKWMSKTRFSYCYEWCTFWTTMSNVKVKNLTWSGPLLLSFGIYSNINGVV